MQRLDLNLASNPFRNNTLLWIGYSLATVLLVFLTVWNVNTFVAYRARLHELQQTAGNFETQQRNLETRAAKALNGIRRYDLETLQVQASKANEMIDWKAFSWTRLFNELERVQPYQVRMNAIRPVFNTSRTSAEGQELQGTAMPVAIEGTARNYDAFAELEQALQEDAHFGRVLPQRLTKASNGEILFQLRFLYYPDVEAESDPASQAVAGEQAPVADAVAAVNDGEPEDTGEEATDAGEAAAEPATAAAEQAGPDGGGAPLVPEQNAPEVAESQSEKPADSAGEDATAGQRGNPGRGKTPRTRDRLRRPSSPEKKDGS